VTSATTQKKASSAVKKAQSSSDDSDSEVDNHAKAKLPVADKKSTGKVFVCLSVHGVYHFRLDVLLSVS